jgi:hypothetical protein
VFFYVDKFIYSLSSLFYDSMINFVDYCFFNFVYLNYLICYHYQLTRHIMFSWWFWVFFLFVYFKFRDLTLPYRVFGYTINVYFSALLGNLFSLLVGTVYAYRNDLVLLNDFFFFFWVCMIRFDMWLQFFFLLDFFEKLEEIDNLLYKLLELFFIFIWSCFSFFKFYFFLLVFLLNCLDLFLSFFLHCYVLFYINFFMIYCFDQFIIYFFDQFIVYFFSFFTLLFWFLYYDSVEMFLVFFIYMSTWFTLTRINFRHKFTCFLILLLSLLMWGMWASFDGIIIMVFLIELLLIIILFLVFLSFKVNDSAHIKISILFYIFFI